MSEQDEPTDRPRRTVRAVPGNDDVNTTTDITALILDDHERFRRAFAELDELQASPNATESELSQVWDPLAALLDLHAQAEEEIFYPQLLRRGDDAEEETLDAVGDHNDIRDAVRDAGQRPVASSGWWESVGKARVANDEHMAEEEREALADFRRNSPKELRESLGRGFLRFKEARPNPEDIDSSDRDPEQYVRDEQQAAAGTSAGGDSSLGIGGLRGDH
ncbi:MAG TPA: hemerythrin domain-containing protein [Pseudonocardia sp.]|jgi:hypothetical protein|uniref:hemerythrin domain-containing protein n=1 Tax=Pseudonocardia sp. TaxID=60912 RepID=UPI002F4179A2